MTDALHTCAIESALEWDNPMTSAQAQKYHMTCGFIALELFTATQRENAALNRQLASRDALLDRCVPWLEDALVVVDYKPEFILKLRALIADIQAQTDAGKRAMGDK